MQTLPAQEIKRCGISAVDKALEKGPVAIIKNNIPQYIVLSQQQYETLLEEESQSSLMRLKSSLDDVKKGRVKRYKNIDKMISDLGLE